MPKLLEWAGLTRNPLAFESTDELAAALRRAAAAHHKYEEALGVPDPDWAQWYAVYLYQSEIR